MKKITMIKFKNYCAFCGDGFNLETGNKNVMIYGENGSGKSSLYRGLQAFFQGAEDGGEIMNNDKNLFADFYKEDKTMNEVGVEYEE